MQDVNVLVVFYSRTGTTEQLALTAAVGAVQGRAFIRLRLLPDAADEAAIIRFPEWKENRDRMNKEYVAPRESDAGWADAIIMGMPESKDGICPEFQRYFDTLQAAGKIGALFTAGPPTDALRRAMTSAGFVMLSDAEESDPLTAARMQGRRAAEAARAHKSSLPVKPGEQAPART